MTKKFSPDRIPKNRDNALRTTKYTTNGVEELLMIKSIIAPAKDTRMTTIPTIAKNPIEDRPKSMSPAPISNIATNTVMNLNPDFIYFSPL